MKTFIFWNKKYQGVVGGGLWEQFIVNARAGHGTCHLIDANSVKEAKEKIPSATATYTQGVFVHGELAVLASLKGGTP